MLKSIAKTLVVVHGYEGFRILFYVKRCNTKIDVKNNQPIVFVTAMYSDIYY